VPARVQIIAKEYSFTLSRTEIPAGRVILEFVNNGEDEHNLHAVEPTKGSEAGEVANTASGAHEDLTLTMRAGRYTLFCSLPKHEEKGMKATLVVN
jgi:plastocyanin